jgi:uncharacterized protein DUF4276
LIRLHFVVEGQTEEAFVRDLLGPHLWGFQVVSVVRSVDGISRYPKLKNDLLRWMREDRTADARFTSMVDLYRLPWEFPGRDAAQAIADPFGRVQALEDSFAADIADARFIPYIQLHEFEALLFSNPDSFAVRFPERAALIQELHAIRIEFSSPEHIDDDTPPSKRILAVFPDYDKVAVGPLVINHIGLERVRRECRHFHDWILRLEGLTGAVKIGLSAPS